MRAFLNIKNVKTVALATVFICILAVGCKKDEEDPAPNTPTTDPKLRFIADWTCTEVSRRDPPAQPFQVHVINSTADTVLIENIYALGFQNKAKAIIYGDSIKIAPDGQQVGSVFVLDGKGKMVNSNKFTMTYVIDDGNTIKDTVDATFTK
ncbi:MAG: hypothetical protein Q8M29_10080 [Bacteroidota bacterium]|nr:hypothetical protein [Bacteroidota bacterium]